MVKELISKEVVKEKIDRAEKMLDECFGFLMDLKCVRDDLVPAITEFQPRLADCLHILMQFYQELQTEKKELISNKKEYDNAEFREIMKTNAAYSKVVRTTIEIGKSLGDAFAWFFYQDNRSELEKHFEHEPTGLFTAGVGGRGELAFLKNTPNISGLYVLYHGITDMLRVGDFSLYAAEAGIVGVGELKTKKEGENILTTAAITAKGKIQPPPNVRSAQALSPQKLGELSKDFPRLPKQLEIQTALVFPPKIDHSAKRYTSYEYELIDSLSPEHPVAINEDNSLLLCAFWSTQEHLFNVLYVQENPDIPRELTEGTKRLVEIENPNNSAVIGEIDTRMFYSRIPILWWPIGDDICKNIYFRRVAVSTVFNPAKLIQRFVDEGFAVVGSGDIQKIKFEKVYGNRRLQFRNFGSLCDLISHSLMKTEDVFLSSKEIICACERGDIPVNSKVDMHIQLHNFGEQMTDEEE